MKFFTEAYFHIHDELKIFRLTFQVSARVVWRRKYVKRQVLARQNCVAVLKNDCEDAVVQQCQIGRDRGQQDIIRIIFISNN